MLLTIADWRDISDIAQSLATTVAVIAGGGWAIWRFTLHAEHRANPRLELDARFLGRQGQCWIVEVSLSLENMGKVPYEIQDINLTTRVLRAEDALASCLYRKGNLLIDDTVSESSLLSPGYVSTVDPLVTTKYTQLCALPEDATFANFYVEVLAPGSGVESYYVERTFSVPVSGMEKCEQR